MTPKKTSPGPPPSARPVATGDAGDLAGEIVERIEAHVAVLNRQVAAMRALVERFIGVERSATPVKNQPAGKRPPVKKPAGKKPARRESRGLRRAQPSGRTTPKRPAIKKPAAADSTIVDRSPP